MSFRTVYGYTHSEKGWRMCNRDECDIVRIPDLYFTDTAPIRKGAPHTIFGAWLYWYDRNVEEIVSPVWGWSATNDVPNSNHLAAIAVDINAPKYPWGKRVMPQHLIAKVREGMALFSLTGRWQDSVIFWGADWNRADEMHYDLRFPEGDGRNDQMAQKLRDGYLGIYKPSPSAPPAVDAAAVLARATGVSIGKAGEILPAVRDGLIRSDCKTVPRIAMWLAQCGHESDGFNTTEEYADGPPDQERWMYKGRTWIQLTWRSAYEGFGRWCHERGLVADPMVFVNNPRSLADLRWAGLGAAYYWTTTVRSSRKYPTLNQASDAGDVLVATQIINGGTNGLVDRENRYNRALAVDGQLLTLINPTVGDDDLTPEQDQMLRAIFREQTQQHPSRSALRKPGEGKVDTWCGMDLNTDGNVHLVATFLRAWLGHRKTLDELRVVAGMTDPARRDDAELAQAILAETQPKPKPVTATSDGGVDMSAVVDAVRSAVVEAEPKIIYTSTPEPAPATVSSVSTVSESGSAGQRIGALVDAVERMQLSEKLSPQESATLKAVISILEPQTKPEGTQP